MSWNFIKNELEKNKIEIIGISKIGESMNSFEKARPQISEELFLFLIENSLNRYLFGLLLRMGSLDVNNIPFRQQQLDSNVMSQVTKESFIKKYVCSCGHTLFRKHIGEFSHRYRDTITCPICDKQSEINYFNLENEFELNRNDLIKFLNRLVQIGIVTKRLEVRCVQCKNQTEYKAEIDSLKCKKCGNLCEAVNIYEFLDDFWKHTQKMKDGSWFEWYVYKICSEIYPYLEHNIIISFNEGKLTKEMEIDIACLDEDSNLYIFECKDYFSRNVGFGEMDTLPFISQFCKNIYFVSSNKIDNTAKTAIQKILSGCNIAFLQGTALERQFISEERVIDLFEQQKRHKGTRLLQKLNVVSRDKIFKKFIGDALTSKLKDENSIRCISTILWDTEQVEMNESTDIKSIEEIINYCIANIKILHLVEPSIDLIRAIYYKISSETLFNSIDINELIRIGTLYLTENSLEGYKERKPFYYFYCELLSSPYLIMNKLNKEVVESFLEKFVSMFDIYYGDYSRINTLKVINILWAYMNIKAKQRLLIIAENMLKILKKEKNNYSNSFFKLIRMINDKKITFSQEQNIKIKELIDIYILPDRTFRQYFNF